MLARERADGGRGRGLELIIRETAGYYPISNRMDLYWPRPVRGGTKISRYDKSSRIF